MKDSIGREHENARAAVFYCPCGGVNITHSLSGEIKLNESGWGVWEHVPHTDDCATERLDDEGVRWVYVPLGKDGNARWEVIVDSGLNIGLVVNEMINEDEDVLIDIAIDFAHKQVGFSDLKAAVAQVEAWGSLRLGR